MSNTYDEFQEMPIRHISNFLFLFFRMKNFTIPKTATLL